MQGSGEEQAFQPTIAFPVLERLQYLDKKRIAYIAQPNRIDRVLDMMILWCIPRTVTPNAITIFRFLTVPFVLGLLLNGSYFYAFILFAISAFSDAVDGALARTRGQVTDWGILFDPLADKLLVGSVSLLIVSEFLGMYLALVIVTLEILIILSTFVRFGKQVVPAKLVGKIKMICQSFGVCFLFAFALYPSMWLLGIAAFLLIAAVLFALLSLFVYRSI